MVATIKWLLPEEEAWRRNDHRELRITIGCSDRGHYGDLLEPHHRNQPRRRELVAFGGFVRGRWY